MHQFSLHLPPALLQVTLGSRVFWRHCIFARQCLVEYTNYMLSPTRLPGAEGVLQRQRKVCTLTRCTRQLRLEGCSSTSVEDCRKLHLVAGLPVITIVYAPSLHAAAIALEISERSDRKSIDFYILSLQSCSHQSAACPFRHGYTWIRMPGLAVRAFFALSTPPSTAAEHTRFGSSHCSSVPLTP